MTFLMGLKRSKTRQFNVRLTEAALDKLKLYSWSLGPGNTPSSVMQAFVDGLPEVTITRVGDTVEKVRKA